MPAVGRVYNSSGLSLYGGQLAPVPPWVSALSVGAWTIYDSTLINVKETTGLNGTARSVLETNANQPLTNWSGKGCYDKDARKLILLGTAQGYSSSLPVGANTKEVVAALGSTLGSLTWSVYWNPTGRNEAHTYDSISSRPLNGKLYRKSYNNATTLMERTLASEGAWTASAYTVAGLSGPVKDVCALEVHPSLGAQGSVLIFDAQSARVIRWDVASGTRSTIAVAGLGHDQLAHYVPALDAVVFGGGLQSNLTTGSNLWWKIDSTGTVSALTVDALPAGVTIPSFNNNRMTACADPGSQPRSWVVSSETNKIYSVDWNTGAWTDRGAIPSGIPTSYLMLISLTGANTLSMVVGSGRDGSGNTNAKLYMYRVA